MTNKTICFIVGITGAGKSTLSNALINGIDSIELQEESETYTSKKDIMIDGVHMFKIGSDVTSCTEIPGYSPFGPTGIERETFLIDCPGFADSNQKKEYSNMTMIHDLLKKSNKITFNLVFKGADIEASRSKGTIQILT